jgi:divalent metal cation (Fe/Co/Zn/Cd) transporter
MWQLLAMFLLAVAFFIFDSTLRLGELQHAVYALWTAYAAVAFFVINEAIALIQKLRNKSAKKYALSGFIVGLFGIGLAALAYLF